MFLQRFPLSQIPFKPLSFYSASVHGQTWQLSPLPLCYSFLSHLLPSEPPLTLNTCQGHPWLQWSKFSGQFSILALCDFGSTQLCWHPLIFGTLSFLGFPISPGVYKGFIKKELPGELESVWGRWVGKERHQSSSISDQVPASDWSPGKL